MYTYSVEQPVVVNNGKNKTKKKKILRKLQSKNELKGTESFVAHMRLITTGILWTFMSQFN